MKNKKNDERYYPKTSEFNDCDKSAGARQFKLVVNSASLGRNL